MGGAAKVSLLHGKGVRRTNNALIPRIRMHSEDSMEKIAHRSEPSSLLDGVQKMSYGQ
jgi:hypothetical protein